jgi:hypothetical protein
VDIPFVAFASTTICITVLVQIDQDPNSSVCHLSTSLRITSSGNNDIYTKIVYTKTETIAKSDYLKIQPEIKTVLTQISKSPTNTRRNRLNYIPEDGDEAFRSEFGDLLPENQADESRVAKKFLETARSSSKRITVHETFESCLIAYQSAKVVNKPKFILMTIFSLMVLLGYVIIVSRYAANT